MLPKLRSAVALFITSTSLFTGTSLVRGAQINPDSSTTAASATVDSLGMPEEPSGVEAIRASTLDGVPAQASDSVPAHQVTVTAGLAVTPNRKATEGGVWNQESRNGPSMGVEYQAWKGVFTELNYVNTNTRLQNYAINTWTMNRLSLDAGYERRWSRGKLSPFVKVGGGVMVLISGYATNNTTAGLDKRMEVLTGTGFRYRLNNHMSTILEYEGRLIRNPDFSDHSWKPQRNFLSEGSIGISYVFGGRGKESLH